MPSTFVKTSFFTTFLLLASAHAQTQTQTGSWAIGALNDWASSGNYLIYSCGSEAPDVKSILDQTYLSLQGAIQATDRSVAYKAFFRSADPAPVTAVLKSITAGTNITTASHGSRRPTLVCVNALDAHIRNFWKMCHDSEGTVVIQPPETSIIFLCPIFFSINLLPLSTECGTVNHAKTRLIPHGYMAGTQYGFLVQTLADMYIRETMHGKRRAPGGDVRDENACLALPPDQAVMNPSTYAFYASNVRAGCTRFPSRVPVQGDRELLAVDGTRGDNETDILRIGCAGTAANSSACSL